MSLIHCVECGREYSDRAAACPQCGCPTAGQIPAQEAVNLASSQPVAAEPALPPQPVPAFARKQVPPAKGGNLKALIWVAIILTVVGVVTYSVLPRSSRDTVNLLASRAGVVAKLIPWVDRADTAIRKMLEGASGAVIASSIQRIAHPSGNSAKLADFSVRRIGDQLSVRLSVNWRGGLLGTGYRTNVVWEFDQARHISAKISGDNGPFGVGEKNASALDDYFRTEAYPVLHSNVGN